MQNPTPTRQELSSYFFDRCTPEISNKVERWFFKNGNSQEAKKLLFSLWEELEDTTSSTSPEEIQAAFEQFKARLLSSAPQENKSKKPNLFLWIQRIAAILILPLIISTIYFALKKDPIEYIEIRTNPGMVAAVNLPDGTKVWLNSRSYLKHPTRFTGNTRDVVLNGEAYFSVHKDKSKRFTVSTPFDIKAEVLGTEFNMEAYAADSSVRTTLVSGSIRLSFLDDNQKHKSFLMKPNEEFTYNQYTKKVKVDKPYIPTQTSWKDGLVVFRNTPFNEALKVLSKRFNVEFIVKNDKLYNNSFTGPFDGQHLQLILEHFRLASGIQYRFIDPQTGQEGNIKEKTIVELY